ncbi:MAG: response regulator [Candidatus Rokubacteria bacterium]|jgi:CheY-like chemotaxis protein|nr:response regulator [Candidatus Rokubacteria bacterium]
MAKVLLVDADWENLVALQKALATAGYEVAVALSGSFALTMLEWDRPDLIVSLAENQDMDAYELCSIIRADPATRDIPLLLLTGPAGPIPGAAARAGISRVIAGKFNLSTLVSQVGELLSRKTAAAPVPSATPASARPTSPAERSTVN